ncbi:hypothetical protein BT69DRAFT_1157139 [Atractiella rhizophila]|nr:hypothetical protein BT69DRAFT_1157139 [Atractiella rhizophila]
MSFLARETSAESHLSISSTASLPPNAVAAFEQISSSQAEARLEAEAMKMRRIEDERRMLELSPVKPRLKLKGENGVLKHGESSQAAEGSGWRIKKSGGKDIITFDDEEDDEEEAARVKKRRRESRWSDFDMESEDELRLGPSTGSWKGKGKAKANMPTVQTAPSRTLNLKTTKYYNGSLSKVGSTSSSAMEVIDLDTPPPRTPSPDLTTQANKFQSSSSNSSTFMARPMHSLEENDGADMDVTMVEEGETDGARNGMSGISGTQSQEGDWGLKDAMQDLSLLGPGNWEKQEDYDDEERSGEEENGGGRTTSEEDELGEDDGLEKMGLSPSKIAKLRARTASPEFNGDEGGNISIGSQRHVMGIVEGIRRSRKERERNGRTKKEEVGLSPCSAISSSK